jgi:hypothetical protein
MMDKILQEWDMEYRRIKQNIEMIDVIGKVATVLVSLGFLVKDGLSAMKLAGDALEVANKKLMRTALKDAYLPIAEIAVEASGITKEGKSDSLTLALGKQTLDVAVNWTTPSWWAGKIDNLRQGNALVKGGRLQGTDIDQINNQTIDQINKTKRETLANLDKSIKEAENVLAEAKKKKYNSSLSN